MSLIGLLFTRVALAAPAGARVVVIVDTSISMREEGYDPQRSSLLVTRLLSDVIPGSLVVVRLLDLQSDRTLLPMKETPEKSPCSEDPSKMCTRVEADGDWEALARTQCLGCLVRPARGDVDYKLKLDGHLAQQANNSLFHLAFRSAQGTFTAPSTRDETRMAIWLSDGRPEEGTDAVTQAAIRELTSEGVKVKPILFGKGDPSFARSVGLEPDVVSGPLELMKAFANLFREAVQAPYRLDGLLSSSPTFEMRPNVDEAWVVVYGDETLGETLLEGPRGVVVADHAADRLAGAGAYRVAYLDHPAAGTWTVSAKAGGQGVAWAVVQRSDLSPIFLGPATALSGAEVVLEAGVRAGDTTQPLALTEVLADLRMEANIGGQLISLHDDGQDGDRVAWDGVFSAKHRFEDLGRIPVTLNLKSSSGLVDRVSEASVLVEGTFRNTGGAVVVDLGPTTEDAEVCRPLPLVVEQQGAIPFSLVALRSLPGEHTLELRAAGQVLRPGEDALPVEVGQRWEVCLLTGRSAPSSTALGEPWLRLDAAGGGSPEREVEILLRWQVEGVPWWLRWLWLILLILAVALVAFVAGGYILPRRFSSTLAVGLGQDRRDLDEQAPQPLAQWRGVGIGFYRDARAFLHPNFRVSGQPRGCVAELRQRADGLWVLPGAGEALYFETIDDGWEPVGPQGRRASGGQVYRSGSGGYYFRIAYRSGR